MNKRFNVVDDSSIAHNALDIEFDGVLSKYDQDVNELKTDFQLKDGMESQVTNSDINVKLLDTNASDHPMDAVSFMSLPVTSVKISKAYASMYDINTLLMGAYMLKDVYFDGTLDEFAALIENTDLYNVPSFTLHCTDVSIIYGCSDEINHVRKHFFTDERVKVDELTENIRFPEGDLTFSVKAQVEDQSTYEYIEIDKGNINLYAYIICGNLYYSYDDNITFDGNDHQFFTTNHICIDGYSRLKTDTYYHCLTVVNDREAGEYTPTGDTKDFGSYGIFYKYNNYNNEYYFSTPSLTGGDVVDEISVVYVEAPQSTEYTWRFYDKDVAEVSEMTARDVFECGSNTDNCRTFTLNNGFFIFKDDTPSIYKQYIEDERLSQWSNAYSIEKGISRGYFTEELIDGVSYLNQWGDLYRIDINNIIPGLYQGYNYVELRDGSKVVYATNSYKYLSRFDKDFHTCQIIDSNGLHDWLVSHNGIFNSDSFSEGHYDYELQDIVSVPEGIEFIGDMSTQYCHTITFPNSLKYIESCSLDNVQRIFYNGTIDEWNAIEKEDNWTHYHSLSVYCTNGVVQIVTEQQPPE